MCTMWSCIIKVNLMKKSNMKNTTKEILDNNYLVCAPDTITMLEYIKQCENVMVIPERLYYYRIHETSMTAVRTYVNENFKSVLYKVKKFKEYITVDDLITPNEMAWLILVFFYELIDLVITRIPVTPLTNTEKITIYNEIFSNDKTLEYLALSVESTEFYYLKCKSSLISIIKLYDVENFDVLKKCIDIIFPKSSCAFTADTLAIFQKNEKLLKNLLLDDNIAIALLLIPQLKNATTKNIVLPVLKDLCGEENIIDTIDNPDFLFRYKKITEHLINSDFETLFDLMTDTIMSKKKIEYTEIYLNLYITLSSGLGIDLGELVGNLKLAEFFYEDKRLEESKDIANQLVQIGFQSDELDILLSKLNAE